MSNEQGIPLVLALDDASATLEQVGGKGASLARLAAAGLPVPPGFHVTEDGLQEAILEAVAGIVGDAYERYRSLPTYPTLIRGPFDPFRWAADPNRRTDLFDARGEQ